VEAYEPDIDRVLITSEQIQDKLRDMGERITADYAGRQLLLVGVLKGAFVVMADLARNIRLPLEFDFMAVASYGTATKTSGVVRILKDLDHELEGRDVLLVEDVVDTGLTLAFLTRCFAERRPASLAAVTLLDRPYRRLVEDISLRHIGFTVPDELFAGYGLGLDERWRALPDLHVVAVDELPAAIDAA
jgi:hypoxanthine phosphoribosyltransferase